MKKFVKVIFVFAMISILAACSEKPSVVISACSIDSISNNGNPSDAKVLLKRGGGTLIKGWIADIASSKTPEKVYVTLVGENDQVYSFGESDVNVIRKDVSNIFAKSIDKSGFNINVHMNSVPPGLYAIQLTGTFDDLIGVCTSSKKIEIK